MIRRTGIFIYFWCAISWVGFGQGIQQCGLSYEGFRKPILLDESRIQVRDEWTIIPEYLDALNRMEFHRERSKILYWNPIRLATRQEYKSKQVDGNSFQKVGKDRQIHEAVPVPPDHHFFRITDAFEGDFEPQWNGQIMRLPMGIQPAGIMDFRDATFKLLVKNPSYLLLEAYGRTFVFYRGYPELSEIFQTKALASELGNRNQLSNHFEQRNLLVLDGEWGAYRSGGGLTFWDLVRHPGDRLLQDSRVEVERAQMTISAGLGDSRPVVIDETAVVALFDHDCMLDELESMRLELMNRGAMYEQEMQIWVNQIDSTLFYLPDLPVEIELRKRFRWARRPGMEAAFQHRYEPHQMIPREMKIRPWVDEVGNMALESQLFSPKGAFHTQITLIVDGARRDSLVSSRISALDARHQRAYHTEGVLERVRFNNPADIEMMEFIARNLDKKMMVRFHSGPVVHGEQTLDLHEKIAIRDAWLYGQLLSQDPPLPLD
ncbi:hypothetical protein [Pontibacter sp. G13]|uniref:hypothetical protein n=1 Tax=Pontibacter sp. G13 TaxID=3074898 RepID=UPI00288A9266|nr:hypothetical protein [Pontibacter sp. G13]WNJ20906.1 hypothetical protein RJD25_10550 [Pontibacter sp. G13]